MMTDEPESRKDRTTIPIRPLVNEEIDVPEEMVVAETQWVAEEYTSPADIGRQAASGLQARQANELHGLKLGPLSVILLVALAIYQVAQFGCSSELIYFETISWLAAVWAGWAISIWLLVRQPISITRAITLGGLLGWHCMLLALHQGLPPERYLVLLGCYGLMQSVASVALNLPTFRFPNEPSQPRRKRPQFGILTISVLTTGLAVVMFAARRYGQIGEDDFFTSTFFIMASLLMVSMSAIVTSHSQLWWSIGIGLVIFTATIAATLMVTLEELAQGPISNIGRSPLWFIYLSVVMLFGVILHTFGTCGKLDAQKRNSTT